MRKFLLSLVTVPIALYGAQRASAAEKTPESAFYTCTIWSTGSWRSPHYVITKPIRRTPSGDWNKDYAIFLSDLLAHMAKTGTPIYEDVKPNCEVAVTEQDANAQFNETVRRRRYDRNSYNEVEWAALASSAKAVDASVKTLALSFRSAVGPRTGSGVTGYQRADFKLNYKALLCAGEVQIAYSVDRQSLKLGTYQAAWGNEVHNVTPLRDAPMPVTVPILLTVYDGPARNNIGRIDDKIAGESLGMGCFTGQTKSIGKASVLIGAKATPEAIRKYLAAIYLDAGLGVLNVYLRHPDIVVPPYRKGQEIEGPQFRQLKVAGTTQGGEAVREAVVAPEPSRPLYDPAETARNQARVAKLLAEADARRRDAEAHPAKMEAFREAQAARLRKIAEDQAAYDARMAEWRRKVAACTAGDRASCAQ